MPEQPTRQMRIAVARMLIDEAQKILDADRRVFAQENEVQTRLPVTTHRTGPDGRGIRIGSVTVNPGHASFEIDYGEAIPYMIERWGEQAVELAPRLREPYLNSLKAEAQAAEKQGKPLPPGVSVTYGEPYTAYYPNKQVDGLAEIAAMIREGVLDLGSILAARPSWNELEEGS